MEFDWDDAKRAKTLAERHIDFADMPLAFTDLDRKVWQDVRRDYGEARFNMLAKIRGRVFHITFTPRGPVIWIISARKANDREQRVYFQSLH